jgi:hypothetical protein
MSTNICGMLLTGENQKFVKRNLAQFLSSTNFVGRDISVGIATRYGLVGPGIESRWKRDFPHQFRPALGPTQLPIHLVTDFFSGAKAAGVWG